MDTYGTGPDDGRSSSVYQQHEKELTLTGNISKFSMYLKVVGGIELLVTIGLMINKVWFANFTGLVLGVMAIQGARLQKRDLTFTHMVLAVLEFAKNVGMVIFFFGMPARTSWIDATIALAFIDNILILPMGGYLAFKLWSTLRAEMGVGGSAV